MTKNDHNNYCIILAGGRVEDCGPAAAMLIPNSFLISSVWDVLSCSKLMTGWQGLCQPTISISIPTKSMWNL